jgi:hypothetical protein
MSIVNTIEINIKHEDWYEIVKEDVISLIEAESSYGDSWKKRGGVDSFMMLARKWDRIENQVEKHGFNILKAGMEDQRPEGIIDDIRDLRRYLLLVEQELLKRNRVDRPEEASQQGEPLAKGYVDQD